MMKSAWIFGGLIFCLLVFGAGYWTGNHFENDRGSGSKQNSTAATAEPRFVPSIEKASASVSKSNGDALAQNHPPHQPPYLEKLVRRKESLEEFVAQLERTDLEEEELINVAIMTSKPDAEITRLLPEFHEAKLLAQTMENAGLGLRHPKLIAMNVQLNGYVDSLSREVGKIHQELKIQLAETQVAITTMKSSIYRALDASKPASLLTDILRSTELDLQEIRQEHALKSLQKKPWK